MDWEISTGQGSRSLIAAFLLTLAIAGPLVLLNDTDPEAEEGVRTPANVFGEQAAARP